jgi:uncharacterized protein (TIGR04255 family)
MATSRRLTNPPIKEALVDVKVTGGESVDVARLRSLHPELRDRYPNVEEHNLMEAKVQVGKPGSIAATSRQVGFMGTFFKSGDKQRVAQFRRDGFTFNQVGHYSSADDLFDEVVDLWPRYLRAVEPKAITTITVRYINELALPLRAGDSLQRFLLAPPLVPAQGQQLVRQFQVRLVLIDQPTDSRVQVDQSLVGGKADARYVLDIIASHPGPLPIETSLREHLDVLRDVKNRVFFSMVTDEALLPYDNPNATSRSN